MTYFQSDALSYTSFVCDVRSLSCGNVSINLMKRSSMKMSSQNSNVKREEVNAQGELTIKEELDNKVYNPNSFELVNVSVSSQ